MSAALLAVLALLPPQDAEAPGRDRDSGDRVARIGRIGADRAPVLDGDLSDPCWEGAPPIGELVEVEPDVGMRPDQRTVVRMLHDRTSLYMAIQCFDEDPEGVRGTQRARDARLNPDDRVEWLFDPFLSRKNGVWFQVGAGGSYGDALIGVGGFEKSWDTIWDARAKVTGRGWQAEVAIPFRSLPFPEGGRAWGFNLRRQRRQSNSEYRWTNIRQGQTFFRVADAGTLAGFREISAGIGLDVVPFASFEARRDGASGDRTLDPDVGGDLFYRLTPSLTVAATFFTDFAETENDERQINLTRFPLFFPEKRDFFLEDASRFTFGPSSRGRSFVAFFSRRIGLDDEGEKVPILAGVKVAGEEGPWEIGFLDVYTDTNENVDARRNLGVLRVKRSLAEQTTLGVLGTWGRPTERGDNYTVGVDFYHRETHFIGDQDLRVWAFAMGSQTSGAGGEGGIFGIQAEGEGREWEWRLGTRWTSPEFNPELGFVRRRGDKQFDAELSWLPRPGGDVVRSFEAGVDTRTILSWGNEFTDLDVELPVGVRLHSGDEARFEVEREFERVDADFTLFNGTARVPAGDYWTTRYAVDLESSEGRPISGRANASTGEFFGGDRDTVSFDLSWRPMPLLTLGGEYEVSRVRLPGGSFTARIVEGRVDFDFSPRITLRNLIQYDNESENLGVQSRFRWILEPGSDLFVVLSGNWLETADGSLAPDDQAATIKLVHTLRF